MRLAAAASAKRSCSVGTFSGGGTSRHRVLVLEALLVLLERRGHVEDGGARLDRDDPPRGERAAVADAVDLVDDGLRHVPGPQEVRVQRVHVPVGGAVCTAADSACPST